MTFSLNPVALKELRQLVRARLVTFALVVYPLILFAATALAVSSKMGYKSPEEIAYGPGLADGPYVAASIVLGLVTCFALPLFCGIKTAIETPRDRIPLEFTTILTPAQIVGGKMTAAGVLIAALTAVSLPFFTLAYLMRGISLVNAFLMPLGLAAGGLFVLAICLPLATSRAMSVPMRIFSVLAVVIFGLPFAEGFSIINQLTLTSSHVGTKSALEQAKPFVVAIVTLLTALLVSRAQSAAQLAPPHTDSERPLRKTYALLMPLTLVLVPFDDGAAWSLLWLILGGILAIRSTFNPIELPRTACEKAPRSFLGRLFTFPLTTGAPSGLLLSSAILFLAPLPIAFDDKDAFVRVILVVTELLTVLSLVSTGLHHAKVSDKTYRIAGVVTVLAIGAANFANVLVSVDALPKDLVYSLPCNFYGISEEPDTHAKLVVVLALLAIPPLTLANIRAFRKYRRS